MSGPFKGLVDYASALVAHVEDDCEPQSKKVSVAPQKLPGRGEIQEVTLYRGATGDSCHPEATCVIGIKSKYHWFATNRLCSGLIGDALPLSVTDTTLSPFVLWCSESGGDGPALP